MPEKYRIYIDETGVHDMKNVDDPNYRFLGLTGIIINLKYYSNQFQPEFEALKRKYFSYDLDEPPIFHRKELINKKFPFNCLRDPKIETRFNKDLLQLLKDWDYNVVSVVIDKKTHKEQYGVWQYHPYHYCLAILLERFVIYLEHKSAVGDVLAESRGGKADLKLKDSYRRLYSKGTDYISKARFQNVLTSKELKIKPKINNIAGLQLADLIAYPSRQEILYEKGLIKDPGLVFGKRIWEILENKYNKNFNTGEIWGCGKKFLP